MKREIHEAFILQLAKKLKLNPAWALLGAEFPDIDIKPPFEHRKTFHSPLSFLLTSIIPDEGKARESFLIGLSSHLFLDKISSLVSNRDWEGLINLITLLKGGKDSRRSKRPSPPFF